MVTFVSVVPGDSEAGGCVEAGGSDLADVLNRRGPRRQIGEG